MTTTDARRGLVAASAAEVYEDRFVPALFGQWPAPVLDLLGARPGDRLLDVGCGTGVLARAAAGRVGATGEVVGVDPNPAMLTVARRAVEPVTWLRHRAEDLPFAAGSFDRVACQFALMFVDDRRRAVAQMARVLRPGGTIAVATWCGLAETPGYASAVELLDRVVGPDAADALRAPFVLGDPDELASLLAPSLDGVEVRRLEGVARFESVEAWVRTDITGWTLADQIDETAHRRVLAAARHQLAPFADERGRVAFAAPALVATATAPS